VPSAPSSAARVDGADQHPAVTGTTGLVSESVALDTLTGRDLLMPVLGVSPSALRDTYQDSRSGGRTHEALDIMAPRGTPVRATEGGVVAKLFESKAGGLTVYQFDPSTTYCYYYAHLDRYADGLQEGHPVTRGEVIGYVGSTGNASPDAPHLHFAVFRLGPERQWWKGDPIDPYPLFSR
jgi:murein DD-endopeptidase MepM/ murein hydrolase activator NlpD